ncbi:hypothetical protein ACRALDRAFT_213825 [Sodiomyces alcalophilus JCM 7366]|uniref:uncharacterized protein n=1 Tax=Sodiomyces alcalophilus JCM 7366 TaxID=591952 RepID=UPI0039B50CE0
MIARLLSSYPVCSLSLVDTLVRIPSSALPSIWPIPGRDKWENHTAVLTINVISFLVLQSRRFSDVPVLCALQVGFIPCSYKSSSYDISPNSALVIVSLFVCPNIRKAKAHEQTVKNITLSSTIDIELPVATRTQEYTNGVLGLKFRLRSGLSSSVDDSRMEDFQSDVKAWKLDDMAIIQHIGLSNGPSYKLHGDSSEVPSPTLTALTAHTAHTVSPGACTCLVTFLGQLGHGLATVTSFRDFFPTTLLHPDKPQA